MKLKVENILLAVTQATCIRHCTSQWSTDAWSVSFCTPQMCNPHNYNSHLSRRVNLSYSTYVHVLILQPTHTIRTCFRSINSGCQESSNSRRSNQSPVAHPSLGPFHSAPDQLCPWERQRNGFCPQTDISCLHPGHQSRLHAGWCLSSSASEKKKEKTWTESQQCCQ